MHLNESIAVIKALSSDSLVIICVSLVTSLLLHRQINLKKLWAFQYLFLLKLFPAGEKIWKFPILLFTFIILIYVIIITGNIIKMHSSSGMIHLFCPITKNSYFNFDGSFSFQSEREEQISWLGKKEQIVQLSFQRWKHKNEDKMTENMFLEKIINIWKIVRRMRLLYLIESC